MNDHATPPSSAKLVGYALFCLVMCISALFVERMTVREFKKKTAAKNWPWVMGMITESAYQSHYLDFSGNVKYEYMVENERYEEVIRIRAKFESDVQELTDSFPSGPHVVYYDQNNPSESVLTVGTGTKDYVLLVTPVFTAVVFGLGFIGLCTMLTGGRGEFKGE